MNVEVLSCMPRCQTITSSSTFAPLVMAIATMEKKPAILFEVSFAARICSAWTYSIESNLHQILLTHGLSTFAESPASSG